MEDIHVQELSENYLAEDETPKNPHPYQYSGIVNRHNWGGFHFTVG